MKITNAFIPLLASTSALVSANRIANSISFLGNSVQAPMRVASSIPGDSPLDHCQAAHDNDILTLEYVKLTPNPPVPYVFATFLTIPLRLLSFHRCLPTYQLAFPFRNDIDIFRSEEHGYIK